MGIKSASMAAFSKPEGVSQKQRETGYEEQLRQYKEDREILRNQRRGDDIALDSLINKYDARKDLDLETKMERDSIRTALRGTNNLDRQR